MTDLSGKKLLILGGAFQHLKLVEAAKELGVITYVTDYLPLESAPAKQAADKYFMHNITDIDDIVKMCREENIDGVISTSLDACQIPYFKVCQRLNLPCFGNEEQFLILTDKNAFKSACKKSGVDVIPEYNAEDFGSETECKKAVEFPILIKPCVSRGSRGQTICYSYEEAKKAIEFAKSESSNGKIVIEKYMGQANDFSMTILVINGTAYPIRTVDRILGSYEDGLDKLAVGAAMPSVFTDIYMKNAHEKVVKFIKDIKLVTAPIFMQGFVDGDKVRFYDPGLRFPGGEYERMYTHIYKRNPMYPFIEFALTGNVDNSDYSFKPNDVYLDNKLAAQVLPTLRHGRISKISGLDEIRSHNNVVSVFERYKAGDVIDETHNVNQRFAEIDVVCDNAMQMTEVVRWIYDKLQILDENGNSMIVSSYDPEYFISRNI